MLPRTDLVRPSRAGDQFHYLWAARRCLRLLSPQGDLVAISIEGPSPDERGGQPFAGAGEECIDIAEYFGSEDLQRAKLVRYMQLKHSTLHSTEPWTASGLEGTIRGFAKRYQELLKTFTADALAAKFQFWFVTNRPIDSDFADAAADAAAGAAPRNLKELKKLERFTNLTGGDLAVFSKLLHFKGRQDDYWDQRNILVQDVQGYLPDADAEGPLKLKELVTKRALPEGTRNPTIRKMDVLRALGTDESGLFPAPCQIESLDGAVLRAQERDLMREIIEASAPVVVHASAGVGKTVFASRIARGLPDRSACLLYDCFGNGQYRNASAYRHRHKDALVQIANELAAKGLCHPLIPTSHADAPSYVRTFLHRIRQAATKVRLASPLALLCIVVDAADNAQMAAEEIGETRSFVPDLIRETMPENVRLVFLCRSHRQAYLELPAEAIRRGLEPFSREETAAHLRQRFADATERDIDEFHHLSSHNPRVQALALSRNNTLPDTLCLLGPNPTTVEDTIGRLLEGAIAKLKDNVGPVERGQIDRICAGLAVMRPLIPITILSKISGVDEGAIKSFAIDIGRPLLLLGDSVQFFDEPAETWFREKFWPAASAMNAYIASLTPFARTSAYVASVLPQLMLEAGRFSELVELALTSAALPETSQLERRNVELQRLQFALKAGLRLKRYLDTAKLALKAGGETAGDTRHRRILQANTDLAAAFLESDLIQEIISRRTFGSGWLGSHYAYEAALLSGRPELIGDARSRLRMANEWLGNWSRLPEEERRHEEIVDQDVVELTLASINIHGPAAGAQDLGRWRPREVSFRVGRAVTRRLIDNNRLHDVEALSQAAGNNLCLVLAVTVELRECQRTPPLEVTRRAFRLVASKRVRLKDGDLIDDQECALNAVTALVEAGLRHAICTAEEAAAVLARYLPSEPPRALSSRFAKARFPALRAYCLRAGLQGKALELRDLADATLRAEMDKKNQHSTSSTLLEFQEDIGALLPWYQLWASTLLGRVTKASLDDALKQTREASQRAAKGYSREDFHTSNQIAILWWDILHRLDVADTSTLSVFQQWKDGLKRPLFTSTLTGLARLCGQRAATRSAAVGFALEAFNITKDERADAETKADGYIDVARAILVVSKLDAEAYFSEAIEVASKIGDENLARWDAILDLADRAGRGDRPAARVAYEFARCAELTYDYVARDKHFNWYATIEALCGLCPSSTFAILSRWRDRGFGRSERILPVAVQRLIMQGNLDPRDAVPLVAFRASWTYHRLLDSALVACKTREEKEAAAAYLYRHIQSGGADLFELRVVTSRHGLSIDGLDEAIAFGEPKKRAGSKPEHERAGDFSATSSNAARNWDDVFGGCDLTNADRLAQAYAAFTSTDSPWDHDQFFREAIGRVPVGSEAAFIRAVANTSAFDLFHFRSCLEQAPAMWKDRPATRRALAGTVKELCRRYCLRIARDRYYEVLPFKTACELTGMSESDIAEIVLDAVGATPDRSDSTRLFSLVGLLALKLSEDEALDALQFGLNLFTAVLEEKDGDGPWSSELLPPTDIKVALAGYVWASMAAPEAALRWEGAHAVLGLVALGRQDVLGHMVAFATGKSGGAFIDARLAFYGLHALQWFLIGIARAAADFPAVLAPLIGQLVDWALNDQPHILIRQFAARAALALIDNGFLAGRDDIKVHLANVNLSPFPVVESKSYDPIRHGKNNEPPPNGDNFFFGIDIGPYWYAPLGRVFGLTQDEIESEALRVIRTDFGFAGKGRWEEDERGRRQLYIEGHAYGSHGSYPRADTLHFYHSYHALMIVAGKLLGSMPVHRHSEYGEHDLLADWIDRHDLSRKDGRWLWDRRDSPPLERPSWQDRESAGDVLGVITADDFDEALRAGGMLNIWGYWTTADSKREQSTRICSALVSPDESAALLRTLGTAKNVHDYAIPSAESNMDIDDSGFVLKGWIVDHTEDGGLDNLDGWSGGISWPPPRPAPYIIDLMGIKTDSDCRSWRHDSTSAVMVSDVWGHYDEASHHETANPERGGRLRASLSLMTAMLAKLSSDLIIKVKIDRRRRHRPYERVEDDNERVPTKARHYLLGADGRFRTL